MSGARRLTTASRLVLASHNSGKLREIAALVGPYGITMVSAGDLGLSEPEETAPDFAGNAQIKALAAARAAGMPALADDSGFCVAALDRAPGVLSARWAGPGKDFRVAMEKVHAALGDAADDRAWFVCVLCLGWPDGETASFLGRVEGKVTWPPRGELGFGYDPIFVPAEETRSYGEMPPDEKHSGSHRSARHGPNWLRLVFQTGQTAFFDNGRVSRARGVFPRRLREPKPEAALSVRPDGLPEQAGRPV